MVGNFKTPLLLVAVIGLLCLLVDIGLAVLYVMLVAIFYEGLKSFRDYVRRVEARRGVKRSEWYVDVTGVCTRYVISVTNLVCLS